MAEFFLFFTGLACFLFGFTFIGKGCDLLAGKKINDALIRLTGNRYASAVTGATLTALFGSGAAVNGCVSSLTESGIISLEAGAGIVVGSNTGSTIITHITALGEFFDVSAPCAVFLLIGFILYSTAKPDETRLNFGMILIGAGFVLLGLKTLSTATESLFAFNWFRTLFLIKSPPILLLNGFFISAVFQSSSGVSSVIVLLCGKNGLDFLSAAYIIAGANIGSCVPLVFLERNRKKGKEVAVFNLLFNVLCAVCFFVVLPFLYERLKTIPANGESVAIFHTVLNVLTAFPALAFLNPLVDFTRKLCSSKILSSAQKSKKRKKKSKNFKVYYLNN